VEFEREKHLWARNLEAQGQAMLSAMVGGIRGHRRMGQFFLEQIEAMLEEVAQAPEVLAVGVVSEDGTFSLWVGEKPGWEVGGSAPGARWTDRGVELSVAFRLDPEKPGPMGYGPRRGESRGPRWGQPPAEESWPRGSRLGSGGDSPLARGGSFRAVLILSRQQWDQQCWRAAWTRGVIVALGALLFAVSAAAFAGGVERQWLLAARGLLEARLRHQESLATAAAGLAHETRNPLNIIRLRAQSLAEITTGEAAEIAAGIVEECDRLTTRINQFLAYARPAQQQVERIDCRASLQELQTLLEPDLTARNVRLKWEVAPQVRYLYADPELLRQAVFNLLTNAIAFSPEGETVEVVILPAEGNCWRIEVADRGPGVPESERENLFKPYFSTRAGGTGLGLAIVSRICEVCGWTCGYQPRTGGGAIFYIRGANEPPKHDDIDR
jgi:signal transduction histidine kinase